MNKIIILVTIMLFALLGTAQNTASAVSLLSPIHQKVIADNNNNVLNTISISLNRDANRIHFNTPYLIDKVNITVKDRSNRIILQQNNMTISKTYSITFPPKAKDNQYTVILQKGNHILVERLPKDLM